MTRKPRGFLQAHLLRRHSQRGQALFLVVLLIAAGALIFVFNLIDTTSAALRREKETANALAQASDALIGYAASSATRPGQLPCPDMNNDGAAEAQDGAGCPSGNVGRLPWITIGLPDLRDAAGERLWYAVSTVFTRNSTACCFDNDTKGTLTISQDTAANVITTEAVAVIFSPGLALAGQVRDPANANNPANYLDITDGVNNAVPFAFISAQASPTFNDRLHVVTTTRLWTVVEMRVAREMLALLSAYRAASACACYPWAANNFDDDSVSGRDDGMVPIEVALPHSWGSLAIVVPSWMIGNNEWGKRFFYTVAPIETQDHTSGSLTVNGVSKNLVLITPGPAGPTRPSLNLPDYIVDSENSDGGVVFVTPSSTAYARNRIYTIP